MKSVFSNVKNKWSNNKEIIKEIHDGSYEIFVDKKIKFQKMKGFGGAFTDATVENFNLLNEDNQKAFVKAYFSKDGLNYHLGRYPIHSTDFSSFSYDYLDGTKDLKNINIDKDNNKIALVRRCHKQAKDLELMMSVWSPFSWMKDNKSLYQGGQLLYDFYKPWANYLSDVASLLRDRGVNITMITSQNEPEAKQTWESCIYTAKEEARFVNELSFALNKNNLDNIGIYLVDHNRDLLPKRVIETMKYLKVPVEGIAYHWYDHTYFENLSKTHEIYPDLHILLSECCVELLIDKNPIGDLNHAERYAYEMINDFNNYSEGWIDWNLLLNDIGGPNHVGNYCESPIMVNRDTKELMILPSYYYIGHFSKYVLPGSYRIHTINNTSLDVVSFLTPSNHVVVVILNKTDDDITTKIRINDKCYQLSSSNHSIITLID